MRVVAYCRVSSETQRDNTSLEMQLERISAHCLARQYEVVGVFQDVESASGYVQRREFESALKLVRSSQADGLVCFKLDRFARNTIEGLSIARMLQAEGKHLVIMDLDLDTSTPMGRCVFAVLLAFAELERETIQGRTKAGRELKRSQGGYAGGRPPYGWIVQGRDLVEEPFQQCVRQRVIRWRSAGFSCATIATRLNFMGVPTASGKDHWQATTISQIAEKQKKLIDWYYTARIGKKSLCS